MLNYLLDKYIIDENGCWQWMKSTSRNGYGNFKVGHKNYSPHREMYAIVFGNIPDNMIVCHRCDNRSCINPTHLFLGTYQDNMDDMITKKRHRTFSSYGNNFRGKSVIADGVKYKSCIAAAKSLGLSPNGIRKRIRLGWSGYKYVT